MGEGQPTAEEKVLAAVSHGSFLFGFGVLVPLVIFLIKRDSEFVRRHAAEALVFQAATYVALVISGVLVLVLVGLALLAGVSLAAFVLTIVATVKSATGEDFRYPLTAQLASSLLGEQ